MISAVSESQILFYREFIMGRDKFDPADYGVNLDRKEFDDRMNEEFSAAYRSWTIDELCLHPREALSFCETLKRKYGYFDLPDDIILRTIMNRRKNP